MPDIFGNIRHNRDLKEKEKIEWLISLVNIPNKLEML